MGGGKRLGRTIALAVAAGLFAAACGQEAAPRDAPRPPEPAAPVVATPPPTNDTRLGLVNQFSNTVDRLSRLLALQDPMDATPVEPRHTSEPRALILLSAAVADADAEFEACWRRWRQKCPDLEGLGRDPATLEELDAVRLPQPTSAYQSSQFDPYGASNQPIVLTGSSTDFGVDTNGNGQYDQLRVNVEVALARTDFYEWGARLVDRNGTELGFYTRRATLSAGVATIDFALPRQGVSLIKLVWQE